MDKLKKVLKTLLPYALYLGVGWLAIVWLKGRVGTWANMFESFAQTGLGVGLGLWICKGRK